MLYVSQVQYCDGDKEDLHLNELKECYDVHTDILYLKAINAVIPAFEYLKGRLESAEHPFGCQKTYKLFWCVSTQMFLPVVHD